MPSPSFFSQAGNFISSVQGGVDPRTGLFNINLPLANLHSGSLVGPALALSLQYSPLSSLNEGFGRGFSLNLTRYDTTTGRLTLSTGEEYRVSSSGTTVRQKKLNNFIFKKTDDSNCLVAHKSGLVEHLSLHGTVYLPVRISAPDGRSLRLSWGSIHKPARLLKVEDDVGTVLCSISYPDDAVATTTFRLLPDDAEYGYSIVFKFTRTLLVRVTSNADTTPRRWTFSYDDVGQAKNHRVITGITTPTGLKEEAVYYTNKGMAFPDIAGLPPLPCVAMHRVYPGGGQPAVVTQWQWTQKNYLGKDAGLNQWQPDTDSMLNILIVDYQYGSTAKLMDPGGKRVLNTVTRRYNSYHLQVSQARLRAGKKYRQTTKYHAIVGATFDEQPAQYALPVRQTESWSSGRGTPQRNRVTRWRFDETGNPLRQVAPDGTMTRYVYYPARGEGDACPANPHGFTRWVKSITVNPRRVKKDEPVTISVHRWKKLSALSGEGYAVVADSVTETTIGVQAAADSVEEITGGVRTVISRAYYDDPGNRPSFGREKMRTTTLTPDVRRSASYTHRESFAYRDTAQGLSQSATLTTHDDLTVTRTTLRHASLGHLLSETDAQGVTVSNAYDKTGRVLTRIVAPGTPYERKFTWSYAIDSDGPVTTETDASGNQLRIRVDGAGREISRQRYDTDNTRQWYEIATTTFDTFGEAIADSGSDWLTAASPEHYRSGTTAAFDGWGAVSTRTFSDGMTQGQVSDPVALTRIRSATGKANGKTLSTGTLTTEFDARSRLPVRETWRDTGGRMQGERRREWDGLGRLRLETDELTRKTALTYDVHGRVLTQTLADGTMVSRTYAPHLTGNQVASISVTGKNAVGKTQTWVPGRQEFDGLGRLIKSVSGGRTTTRTYNGASPVPASVTLPSGNRLTYTYIPELGNVVSSMTADGVAQVFSYHALTGQLMTAKEDGSVINNTLNLSGSLKAESFTQGNTVRRTAYTRTLSGAVHTYTDISGKKAAYECDTFGRITTIKDAALTADLTYDALGRLSTQTVTDAVTGAWLVTTLAYDDFGREISRTIADSGGAVLNVRLTWQKNGLLTGRRTALNGKEIRQERYRYNVRNGLTKYTATGSSLPQDAFGHLMSEQRYRYDALNNLTAVTTVLADGRTDVATYHYENADDPTQLMSVTHSHPNYPATITLAYDANGYMTRDEADRILSYDATGRLTGISGNNISEGHYAYDALNRLVSQTVSSTDTRQLYYRGEERVNEVLTQQQREIRLIKTGHTCLGVSHGSSLTLTAGDQHDSLQWSREAGQEKGQQHSWTPYGSGTVTDGLPGFNGERADPVSDTYHLGNGYRAYSPALMRFTCPDSLSPFGAGGTNPYAYCAGDPVNNTDPSGHLSWQGILGIVIGALGLAFSVFTVGASIAAADGVMAALGTASTTSLVVGGLSVAADATAIASGATEDRNPQASSVLGWVSMVTGLAGMTEGLARGLQGMMKTGSGDIAPSSAAPLRLRGGGDEAEHVTGILDLPDEMIREIGSYLPVNDLRSFRSSHPKFMKLITVRDLNASRNARIKELLSYQNAFNYEEIELLKMNRFTSRHEAILVRRMRLENYMINNPHAFNDRETKYLMKCLYKGYQNNYRFNTIKGALELIEEERRYIYGENSYIFPYDELSH